MTSARHKLNDFTGEWRVALYCQGKRIDSCPVDVCDPSRVKVIDLKGGVVGRPSRFKGKSEKSDS